jgi:hypothetical protein
VKGTNCCKRDGAHDGMAGGLAALDCVRDERYTKGEGSSIFDERRFGFCEGDGELVGSQACWNRFLP